MRSPTVAFQSAGLAGSLSRENAEAMVNFARVWPSLSGDPSRARVLFALRNSFRSVDPDTVRQLAALAGCPESTPELRAAGIKALAAIHTRESLPMLASLLRSFDPREQMQGVYGLSSFANGCPSQTPNNVTTMDYLQFKYPSSYRNPETIAHFGFRRGPESQEDEMVSFWLSWWKQNKAALTN